MVATGARDAALGADLERLPQAGDDGALVEPHVRGGREDPLDRSRVEPQLGAGRAEQGHAQGGEPVAELRTASRHRRLLRKGGGSG